MEDLVGYNVLKKAMTEGHVYKEALVSLGETLAKIHASTHKSNLSESDFQHLTNKLK